MEKPVYSFVIPVFNEEDTLPELYRQLSVMMDQLDASAETILVDDGSRDNSFAMMVDLHQKDARFKVAKLSRNFGHQIAISAGMDLAQGDAVIIMDADLQDPPHVVLEMTARWREGYQVVYGVREERRGETWFKRLTASLFYRYLRKLTDLDIPADVGDFRLVDRRALDSFKNMREANRYVRGMFSWVGFKQIGVHYTRSERFAGSTKYPFIKMLKLAADGVVSFSTAPLRLAMNAGAFFALISLIAGAWAIFVKIKGMHVVAGWASLICAVFFLGGLQLILIGVVGEYIGRIYEEVRNRPLYIVSSMHGFSPSVIAERRALLFDRNE